ncbi:MAG: acyl-CoA dehydratase activase-related protein [candidate division WOR-3 bacterium]|nr:acyl-CoA dehydratase activase-related protein [candidate division WOR-3 bacterium]MCX7836362.1 acyl-CoA dehydratase activase-related protein [candidate division WOR-3 bacterium]MDW8113533.1 acyl-CoA dehydratase activase-related protein [candidate division WOR-3 bacterium]
MKIGIPKGLYYYYYKDFLIEFFNNLKLEVVLSTDTDQKTIEEGSKIAPSEICLPVKVFLGHTKSLSDRCDYLFLIRFVKKYVNKHPLFGCPKFIGLPDLIKINFNDFHLLELLIDEDIKNEEESYLSLFSKLGFSKREIKAAYQKAKKVKTSTSIKKEEILVVGHPYVLFDKRLSLDLLGILDKMDIKYITSFQFYKENFDFNKEREYCWYFHRHLLFSAYWAKENNISGVIIINNFPCGTSAVIDERIKEICKNINILQLIIDEHTQKEGFLTRLESFLDMIKIKKK